MAGTASTAIEGSVMIERSLAAYFRKEASFAHPREGVVFTLDCHGLKLAQDADAAFILPATRRIGSHERVGRRHTSA